MESPQPKGDLRDHTEFTSNMNSTSGVDSDLANRSVSLDIFDSTVGGQSARNINSKYETPETSSEADKQCENFRNKFWKITTNCFVKFQYSYRGNLYEYFGKEFNNLRELADRTANFMLENNAKKDDLKDVKKFMNQCASWRNHSLEIPIVMFDKSNKSCKLEIILHEKYLQKNTILVDISALLEEMESALYLIINNYNTEHNLDDTCLNVETTYSEKIIPTLQGMFCSLFKCLWKKKLIDNDDFIRKCCGIYRLEKLFVEVLKTSPTPPSPSDSITRNNAAFNDLTDRLRDDLKKFIKKNLKKVPSAPKKFTIVLSDYAFHILARYHLNRGLPILANIYPPKTLMQPHRTRKRR